MGAESGEVVVLGCALLYPLTTTRAVELVVECYDGCGSPTVSEVFVGQSTHHLLTHECEHIEHFCPSMRHVEFNLLTVVLADDDGVVTLLRREVGVLRRSHHDGEVG